MAGAGLRLHVNANPRYARLVRERVGEFAVRSAMVPTDAEEFVTAVSEAFANAVEHAQAADPVEIFVRLDDEDKLVATITDSGEGFDSAEADIILPPAGAERGRGIPLMRRYSDIFTIRSRPGEGTSVFLARYLRRAASQRKGCGRHLR